MNDKTREGGVEAPTRHPINWKTLDFNNEASLLNELERVYDVCHSCRRCVSLCNAFPTLFNLIDESETFEVDSVKKEDYWNVVEHCYLCDLCYMTKCPYVPPHEWNIDFPHLMLRAKAYNFRRGKVGVRDKILTSTDKVGSFAGIPVVAQTVNIVNQSKPARKVMEKTIGIHSNAVLPKFYSNSLRKRFKKRQSVDDSVNHKDKVAIFVTCYGNRNEPDVVEDLIAILKHNQIKVKLVEQERCCGMPKMELGDLESVECLKDFNIPHLLKLAEDNWNIVAPIPSCVLMFKKELPLLFSDDKNVQKVKDAFYDPFEFLMSLKKEGKLNAKFKESLGEVAYHAPCHQRVQNIGPKTKEILELIPDTNITLIERCSGHNGTYAVKREYHEISMKICKPIIDEIDGSNLDHYISDCPMAGHQIDNGVKNIEVRSESPFTLLRKAYGI
ncbi:MAG: heterodisulfide reductase-related iron-sulfur binding cluster [Pseudomonadota bacterium]|nr:heterodisulfide reductase-related iron-sulfur binding cluster [Pseudomonadota bacterium]|tara:strand:+ start:3531 stop:4859 length:1329 start_codon:yes stop_codon:yes gene_type:complete